MNNRMCEMFGIEAPIFAFTHCRDVLVEVSKAGGLGVLGTSRLTPQKLREELKWIDAHIGGRPYGIDVLMPSSFENLEGEQKFDTQAMYPREHAYLTKVLDEAGVGRLPQADEAALLREAVHSVSFIPNDTRELIEIAFEHPISVFVSALGTPAKEIVDRAHARGIKVAALAGAPKHALKHKEAGCDFVIAVGTEAGGHTGNITSMVLWPRIVDAVAPLPVLGAGGVARGRQVAAALALGCEGVWCGSVWLSTAQSDVLPELKAKLFAAPSEDAVLTKSVTGKQCRTLRNVYTDAMTRPGAPATLPPPLQAILWWGHGIPRVNRSRIAAGLTTAVGQIVGDMTEELSVRQVFHDMLSELIEAKDRMDRQMS